MDKLQAKNHINMQAKLLGFDAVSVALEAFFNFTDMPMQIGSVKNEVGQNLGSKIRCAVAVELGASKEELLSWFGVFHKEVLADPDGDNHPNIRAIMEHGIAGIIVPEGMLSKNF